MTNVRLRSEDTQTNFRGPSVAVFGDLSKWRADADAGKCMFVNEDFITPTALASGTAQNGHYALLDTSCTLTGGGINDTAKELGVLLGTTNNTDDDEIGYQLGLGNQWRIGNTAGNTGKLAFEARVKVSEVTDNACSLAVGLIEGPVAANHVDDNTGEIKDSLSFIGFRSLYDDGNAMDIVYQDTGASAVQTLLANAAIISANTYVNLGFLWDPDNEDAKYVRFFVNGTESNTWVTKTQLDASTFPEDEGMVPCVILKQFGGAAAAMTVSIDRITVGMYGNNER